MPTRSKKWAASTPRGPTLDAVFKIFGCSRRREVVVLLAERELHAHVLADLISVDPGQLSRWMKLLTSAGLIEWRSDGRSHAYWLTDLVEVRRVPPHVAIDIRTSTGDLTLRFPLDDFSRVLDVRGSHSDHDGGK